MKRFAVLLSRLERLRPPYGPCGICGGPDARHRMWDAMEGQSRTSDGITGTAIDLCVTKSEIRAVRAAYDEARRLHVRLPGRYPLQT